MVRISLLCPQCHSDQVIRGGKTKAGQQRYKCQNTDCPRYSFQLELRYKGRAPAIKEQIVDMSLNGSGIRDTARVLKISPTTVINALKEKEPALTSVNQPLLDTVHPDEVDMMIQRVEEAEVDEMWSYMGKKREPRWLWHAIDHRSGHVLAYVLGRRKDEVFLRLCRKSPKTGKLRLASH
jgi:insertion element IS1 protein InsB